MENKQFEEEIINKEKVKHLTEIVGKHFVDNEFAIIEGEALAIWILTQCWKNGPATILSMEDTINRVSLALKQWALYNKIANGIFD